MPLNDYKQKRNLKKSGEPKPKPKIKKISGKKLTYVIHEHFASHHHYDLRLEMNGILKSWAVPKSPPIEDKTKRLAIQVEDHPLNYAKFQGIISEGNYGAGKVKIWDKGNYELIEKTPKKIEIDIKGKKLKGKYVLVKTNYGGKKDNWLFMKV